MKVGETQPADGPTSSGAHRVMPSGSGPGLPGRSPAPRPWQSAHGAAGRHDCARALRTGTLLRSRSSASRDRTRSLPAKTTSGPAWDSYATKEQVKKPVNEHDHRCDRLSMRCTANQNPRDFLTCGTHGGGADFRL